MDHLPVLTRDGLTLILSSERPGGIGDVDLWEFRRSDTASPFAAPRNLSELNTTNKESGSSLSADALTLYFSSDRPGGAGDNDLWVASRPDRDSPFDPPENLSAVNDARSDTNPALSSDGRELFFSSTRASGPWRRSRRTRA